MRRYKTAYIILHHSGMWGYRLQKTKERKLRFYNNAVSWHFFIDRNGDIEEDISIDDVAEHCLGKNTNSIGICFEGDFNRRTVLMPDRQIKAGRELLLRLAEKYDNNIKILPHRSFVVTTCPGRYFPIYEITSDILKPKCSF